MTISHTDDQGPKRDIETIVATDAASVARDKQAILVRRRVKFSRAFSPSAPITEQDLFARRGTKFNDLLQIITQRGQHGVLYGERGVGKTSFATMMADLYSDVILTARVTCASGEHFGTVMRHCFDSISMAREKPGIGFNPPSHEVVGTASDLFSRQNLTPDDVRRALSLLASGTEPVLLIIDEFDRIDDPTTRRKFADLIKALSDYTVDATILLVGVADSVAELISEHESINRALVQMHMPRMEPSELGEIIDKGMTKGGMKISADAREWIIDLSRGLPHYTHLLSLHAGLHAVEDGRDEVRAADVGAAIKTAINKAQQYILQMYETATSSNRPTNYKQVLLACAMTPTDAQGYFAPSDVKEPISKIMGKPYDVPNYIANLNALALDERGRVLQKTGVSRAYRYRFRDPLLQPYVILRGVDEGLYTH